MALNLAYSPHPLTASRMGTPDYGKALQQGYQTFIQGQKAAATPKMLAEEYLRSQIANKLNNAKVPYADQMAKSQLEHLQSQVTGQGLSNAHNQRVGNIEKSNPMLALSGLSPAARTWLAYQSNPSAFEKEEDNTGNTTPSRPASNQRDYVDENGEPVNAQGKPITNLLDAPALPAETKPMTKGDQIKQKLWDNLMGVKQGTKSALAKADDDVMAAKASGDPEAIKRAEANRDRIAYGKSTKQEAKANGMLANLLKVGDLEREARDTEKRLGSDNPETIEAKTRANDAREEYKAEYNARKTINEGTAARTHVLAWKSTPTFNKQNQIAIATGMGMDPSEAGQLLAQGVTLGEMAKERGLKLNDIKAQYPLTMENVKQNQQRAAYSNELYKLEDITSQAVADQGRKFFSYNVNQALDALKNKDPDKQGRMLAARALQPEIAAVRGRALGVHVGIGSLNKLQDAALAQSKVFESHISPEARVAMNKYLTKWIAESRAAFGSTMDNFNRIGGGPSLFSQGTEGNANVNNDPLGIR